MPTRARARGLRCTGAGTTLGVGAAATFHSLVGGLEYPMFIVTARAVPILDECPNWFVGRVLWRAGPGDHDAFLLEPVAAEDGSGEDEFTFHRAKRIDPGHEA